MGYNGRAGLELHGGHGAEAVVYATPCLGLGAPSKVSYGLNTFPMEVPFAKLNWLCPLKDDLVWSFESQKKQTPKQTNEQKKESDDDINEKKEAANYNNYN